MNDKKEWRCVHIRNADYMRRKYHPPYTLDDILDHAESCAKTATSIRGYCAARLDVGVADQLRALGFVISGDGVDVVISWELKKERMVKEEK